jgi:hypothetical protein
MKLTEIANRIRDHLHRFERDPNINVQTKKTRLHPYYCAGAYAAGRFVYVCYVSFQGYANLTKEQAESYLTWLDCGNVGQHWKALPVNDALEG